MAASPAYWRGVCRATAHAVQRMAERVGVELAPEQWDAIVWHARKGAYRLVDSTPGARDTYRVPMGAPDGWQAEVPVVVDVQRGRVITVLDPEPLR